MFYSYDVFDTCLTRSCGKPSRVFEQLAQVVLGNEASDTMIADFSEERIFGENRARKYYSASPKEDITIYDIYEFCDFSIFTTMSSSKILETELEIEKSVLVAVNSVKDEISQNREKGNTIVFISDMYLPTTFIKQVLTDNQLFENDDHLFVSGDIGLTKSTGKLYKYILETLRIDSRQLIHHGDNHDSDVSVPQKIGIRANNLFHSYSNHEKMLIERDFSPLQCTSSIVASIARSVRLSFPNQPSFIFASDFIAPLFVPFVFNILTKAHKQGLSKLYFLARDSTLFYEIAKQLSPAFPEIEIRFLYVSRTSLYLPGLDDVSFESIKKMFWNFDEISSKTIFERLQIDDESAGQFNIEGNNPTVILRSLLNCNSFVDLVKVKRLEQRTYLTKYLVQEGLGEGRCAIVDYSGTRGCHIAINKILKEANMPSVYGFYFSVLSNRIPGNDYYSLYFEDRCFRDPYNLSVFPHDLLEQYFCASPYNRTFSYSQVEDKIVPVFEKGDSISDNILAYRANWEVCTSFARHYSFLLKNANHEQLTQICASVLSAFHYVPTIDSLKAFDGFMLSDSRVSSTPLIQKKGFIRARKDVGNIWLQANILYNSPFPSVTSYLLRRSYSKLAKSGTYSMPVEKVWRKIVTIKNMLWNIAHSKRHNG